MVTRLEIGQSAAKHLSKMKVQRLGQRAVGSSDPKWEASLVNSEEDDIVWSAWKHAAAPYGAG
jgi:hypothetical protein